MPTFVSGDNLIRMAHTPSSAVSQGEVVGLADVSNGSTVAVCIAERPIAASEAGEVVVRGGIWKMTVGASASLVAGQPAYIIYNDLQKVTDYTRANASYGFLVGQTLESGTAAEEVKVEFSPMLSSVGTPP